MTRIVASHLLVLLLATGATRPELAAVPEPAAAAMDAAVQEQLEAQRLLVDELTADPETPAPELAEAYGLYGRLAFAYQLAETAAAAFANADALAPGDPRWAHYRGLVAIEAGRFEEARAAFARVVELEPGSLAASLRLGEALLQAGRPGEARGVFEGILKSPKRSAGTFPGTAAALFGLGRAEAAEGRPAEAAAAFRRALELEPGADLVHYHLGLAYRELGRLDDARSELRRRGTTPPRLPDPLLVEARLLTSGAAADHLRATRALRRGEFDRAIELFERSVAADPENLQAWQGLATALLRAGRPQDALARYRAALAQGVGTDDARFQLNHGTLLGRLGHGDEALAAFRAAVRLAPDFRDAHFNLGLALRERGELDASIHHLERAAELDPLDVAAHLELAVARVLAGRPGAAVDAYDRALALEPDLAAAHLDRAMALLHADRCADAARRLDEGVARLPGEIALRHLLARVLATCPAAVVRDGARALALAQAVLQAQQSLDHAETLAMALAELGRFADAAVLQERLVDEAQRQGWEKRLPVLRARLESYRRGAPIRAPWSTP